MDKKYEEEVEHEVLNFFYDEILCNYSEEETGEVFDGYDD
ncbi:hypothetical protein FHS15_005667 [Paenibacillus castaneae]|nr:hypothetical protein [Paenibacillus castaneae]